MNNKSPEDVIGRITNIIGNPVIASAIYSSIALGLEKPYVHLGEKMSEWEVFEHSLNSAIWDIEKDERGELFKRLLRYEPHDPDDPIAETSDGKTILSDPECGACAEFIFSYMVNCFQGELGELLALEPCIRLVEQLQKVGKLLENTVLYWGNTVQERQKAGVLIQADNTSFER
jgi:hypothetical protein